MRGIERIEGEGETYRLVSGRSNIAVEWLVVEVGGKWLVVRLNYATWQARAVTRSGPQRGEFRGGFSCINTTTRTGNIQKCRYIYA